MKSPEEYPNTTVSDENDENPRYVRYEDIIPNGLRRRVVEVFVVDKVNGKVLLQKRSGSVAVSPNTWTVSVGEGVDEGEEYEDSARRGIGEELGLPVVDELIPPGRYYSETARSREPDAPIIKTWSKVFAKAYDQSPMRWNREEINSVEWFTLPEIDHMLTSEKENFSMRFPVMWRKMRGALLGFVGT